MWEYICTIPTGRMSKAERKGKSPPKPNVPLRGKLISFQHYRRFFVGRLHLSRLSYSISLSVSLFLSLYLSLFLSVPALFLNGSGEFYIKQFLSDSLLRPSAGPQCRRAVPSPGPVGRLKAG